MSKAYKNLITNTQRNQKSLKTTDVAGELCFSADARVSYIKFT